MNRHLIPSLIISLLLPMLSTGQEERKPVQLDTPHPLGAMENPVKCDNPMGERAYLWRLRTADTLEKPSSVQRIGSFGMGPYGHIIDGYDVAIGKQQITVYMDMYFTGYIEELPIPGFVIVSDLSPQLFMKDGKYHKDKETTPYTGRIIDQYSSGEPRAEMNLKDGKLVGQYTDYFKNGQIAIRVDYVDGKRHGPLQARHENGKDWKQGTYVEGQLDGEYQSWHENGQLYEKTTFRHGKINGRYATWHENGQQEGCGKLIDGQWDGEVTMWHQNGAKKAIMLYHNGKRAGTWSFWDEVGNKTKDEIYEDDKLVKVDKPAAVRVETGQEMPTQPR